MTTLRTNELTNNKLKQAYIRRSVASSTAIETGESPAAIEKKLKSGKRRFPQLLLAD